MPAIAPIAVAFVIVVVLGTIGVVAHYIHERRTFAGYGDIEADARMLRDRVKGEVFRDGRDLVISGILNGLSVVVRFSTAENTPGLEVRVGSPAPMNVAIVPRSGAFPTPDLRGVVLSPDDMFNTRFIGRTNDVPSARMLMMSKAAMEHIKKLCCSSRTMLALNAKGMELTETTIPQYAGRHALAHIESLLELSKAVQAMPHALELKPPAPLRERRVGMKIAIACGVIAAIAAIGGAEFASHQKSDEQQTTAPRPPAEIPEEHARAIPGLAGYHVATASDLDGALYQAMRDMGGDPAGKVDLDLSGKGKNSADIAYLLLDDKGQQRMVVMEGSTSVYDAQFPAPLVITRFPKELLRGVRTLRDKELAQADGDAVLMLMNTGKEHVGGVMYLSGGRLVNYPISNLSEISLR